MLLFLLGLVAAVPLAVVANLLTPKVQSALAQRSSSRRTSRVAEIRKDFAFYENLRQVPSEATAYVGRLVIRVLAYFALTVIINTALGVYLVTDHGTLGAGFYFDAAVGISSMTVAIYSANKAQNLCTWIYQPDVYTKRVAAQLAKLGEALDREPEPGEPAAA